MAVKGVVTSVLKFPKRQLLEGLELAGKRYCGLSNKAKREPLKEVVKFYYEQVRPFEGIFLRFDIKKGLMQTNHITAMNMGDLQWELSIMTPTATQVYLLIHGTEGDMVDIDMYRAN